MESVYMYRHWPDDIAPVLVLLLVTFIVFIVLMATFIKVLIFCKIFSKAGYSWALGLLMLLPLVDVIMVLFLAFADWPVCRELCSLKQQQEKFKA
jgi:heme/copper-type cytochrome/quinol oxidase subunit 2